MKTTTGFGLFSSLSKVKIYFFLLFTSNLSYFNSFKLPHKIRLLGFRSPLNSYNKSDNLLLSPSPNTLFISTSESLSNPKARVQR